MWQSLSAAISNGTFEGESRPDEHASLFKTAQSGEPRSRPESRELATLVEEEAQT